MDGEISLTPEVAPNKLQYPFEYVNAQVQFATKWAEVSGVSVTDAMAWNTDLSRVVGRIEPNEREATPSILYSVFGKCSRGFISKRTIRCISCKTCTC